MLDERALRRPDFRGGVPVRLADGQEWTLPHPLVLFTEDDQEGEIREEWNLGPEYAALVAASQTADDGVEVIKTELALFKYLIRLNYDVDQAQLREILKLGYGTACTPEIRQMMDELRGLAFGRVALPKAECDGPVSS